jgi:hypothetical protein
VDAAANTSSRKLPPGLSSPSAGSGCASLSVRLKYKEQFVGIHARQVALESYDSWEIGRAGDEDESEIFYVREKLDGEVLPAKAAAEHADNG